MRSTLRPNTRWLLVVMCIGVHTTPAQAHSRFPAPLGLSFAPDDDDAMLLATTFGLLHTRDGGGHWRYLCHGAMDALDRDSPLTVLTSPDRWTAALIAGVRHTDDAGCHFDAGAEALRDVYVSDLRHHETMPDTLFAATASSERDNALYVSSDGGAHFAQRGPDFGAALVRDLRIAPSDPDVIYVSTVLPAQAAGEVAQAAVARSDDGGERFEVHPFSLGEEGLELRLLAVDPARPQRIYTVMRRRNDEPLLRSDDGGATFETVFTAPRPLLAVALGPEGQDVWVGGSATGLWRSRDGGAHFEQLSAELQVSCLRHRHGTLWVCDDSLTSGFQLGRSDDGGAHFEPVMHFADVEALSDCEAEAPARAMCVSESMDVLAELQLLRDVRDGMTRDTADTGDDDGTLSGGGGCAVGVGPRPTNPGRGAGMALVALMVQVRRRRRRGSRGRPLHRQRPAST